MKIAHVTATFPPYWAGTGNVAYHHARTLQQRGHHVTVFTARLPGSESQRFPFAVDYLPAPLRLGNAPFTPHLIRRLRGFDVIHLHYPYIFGTELVLVGARRYRIPLVLSYHNQLKDQHRLKQALFCLYNHVVEPAALRRSVLLLPVRAAHFHQVHPALRVDSRVREVVNGVDIDLFRPMVQDDARKQIGLPSHAPIALFVGALDSAHRFKNVEGLVRAFASLHLPDALLLVVGDGNLRASLEDLAARLRLEAHVRFVGSRSPDRLVAFYNAANVLVLPSTDVESFGLVLLEAMACGTPVIASCLPGVASLLEDGVDGLLTPPGDEAALASALKSLLREPDRAAAMGRRAREKVAADYAWQAIGARLEQIYREVVQA